MIEDDIAWHKKLIYKTYFGGNILYICILISLIAGGKFFF